MPPNEAVTGASEEEQLRDMNARAAAFGGYRGMDGTSNVHSQQLQQLDTAFRDMRDDQAPPEARVQYVQSGPERGRIAEINAEFVDRALENFLRQYTANEREQMERRYGRGWLGPVRRWFNETPTGRILKIGAKVLGGGSIVAASMLGALPSLGFATPLILSLARKYTVDGVGEAIQTLVELPSLRDVRNAEQQERMLIIRAMQIRNAMRQIELNQGGRNLRTDETINGYQLPAGQQQVRLGQEWERIMLQLDQLSGQRRGANARLDRIQAMGQGLRTVASTATAVGWAWHDYVNGGISLGYHDFDSGKAGEIAAKNLADNSMVPGHEVRFIDGGIHWMAHDPSEYTEMMRIGGSTGPFSELAGVTADYHHAIGGGLPLWESWGSLAAAGGAVAGTAYMEIGNAAQQGHNADNPMPGVPLTLRGGREFGRGTNFEFATHATPIGGERVNQNNQDVIREHKEQIAAEPESVWEMTFQGPPQVTTRVRVIRTETDNFGNQVLRFDQLDHQGNPMPGRTNLSYTGNSAYQNARRMAGSVEEYKNVLEQERQAAQNQPMEQLREFCRTNGYEVPGQNQFWRAKTAGAAVNLTRPTGNAPVTIPANHTIKVESFIGNQPNVRIRLIGPPPTFTPGGTEDVTARSLVQAMDRFGGNRQEAAQINSELLMPEITNLLGREPKVDQLWAFPSANEWLAISEISPEQGTIKVVRQTFGAPPNLVPANDRDIKSQYAVASEMTLQQFYAFINANSPRNFMRDIRGR